MNIFRLFIVIIIVILVTTNTAVSQKDNITWSSIRLRTFADDKTRIDVRPIVRHNEDVSNYQNTSIDFVINRKLGKGWSAQFLWRQWFIPDDKDITFLWWDIANGFEMDNIKLRMNNRARLHLALDTQGQDLADFIRIQHTLTPSLSSKVIPFFSFEYWIRLNGVNDIRRIRIEPGLNWKMSNKFDLTLMYRRQNSVSEEPQSRQNHYVTTLTYNW